MSTSVPFFVGYVSLKSDLDLEDLGSLLSERVFAGLLFGGKEMEIHEEVPAVFIQNSLMGLKVILEGYSGFAKEEYFTLSIRTCVSIKGVESEVVRLDTYLHNLLKVALSDIDEVIVVGDSEILE